MLDAIFVHLVNDTFKVFDNFVTFALTIVKVGCHFIDTHVKHVIQIGCSINLIRAGFVGATLVRAGFVRATLVRAGFVGATLVRARLI